MENQMLTEDPLRQVLLVHLANRRLSSHKEMVEFLMRWLEDPKEHIVYDGNTLKQLPESDKDMDLHAYGYTHICYSFNKMDDVEKLVLRAYFYSCEIERAKHTIKIHLLDEFVLDNK